jgi:dsRNA-specific ribonuclease
MKHEIDTFSANIPKSPVRALYEIFPGGAVKFSDVSKSVVSPSDGHTVMKVTVTVPGGLEKTAFGCGSNKKNAKNAAAKFAIKKFNVL